MGRDKRFLPVSGLSLLQRTARAVQEIFEEVWILLSHADDCQRISEHLDRPARYWIDSVPHCGPLGALAGALPHLSSDYALLLAVDYPFITGSFLQRLTEGLDANSPAKALVPLWEGHSQVTCAFYSRSLSNDLDRAFGAGERSLTRWLKGRSDVRYMLEEEWRDWAPSHVFFNLNTPDQYQKSLKLSLSQPSSF